MKIKSIGKKGLALLLALVFVFAGVPTASIEADAAAYYTDCGFSWPKAGGQMEQRYHSNHLGLDMSQYEGAPIYAIGDGTVICAGYVAVGAKCPTCPGWHTGYHVVIRHSNGLYSSYAHMNGVAVSVGNAVAKGQYIGDEGNTGNSNGAHLHFSIFDSAFNYVNPFLYVNIFSEPYATDITETSATLHWYGNSKPDLSDYAHEGFYFGTDPENLSFFGDYINTPSNQYNFSDFYFGTQNWVGTLKPGVTYYYKFQVTMVDGLVVTSNLQSFTTKGGHTHSYDNDCDTTCNSCGATRTITHTYSNDCDTSCNVCGATRTAGAHKYDNDCDTTCNSCGATRTVTHTYSNACDTSCNVCGATRTVTHNFSVQDKNGTSHWKKCPFCGTVDETTREAHRYTDSQDTSCNDCGFVRSLATNVYAVHRGDQVTVTFATSETVYARGFAVDFSDIYNNTAFEIVSADFSDTIKKSSQLAQVTGPQGVTLTSSILTFSGEFFTIVLRVKDDAPLGEYDLILNKAFWTSSTNEKIDLVYDTTALIVHECKPSGTVQKDANGHWYTCETTACNAQINKAAHSYDNACDADCNVCGYTRTVIHDYSEYAHSTTQHYLKCSLCGKVDETTRENHDFDNACDATCDECGYTRTVIHDYSEYAHSTTQHYLKCSLCGKVDETTRENHDFDNACDPNCDECGYTRTVSGHAWGNWIQTTPPEIGKKGEETRTCANCGTTEKRDVDALQPEYDAKAIFSSKTVRPGEEFEIVISFEKLPKLVGIAVEALDFDREKFELVDAEWTVSDTTLQAWWMNDESGVCAFASEKDCNGEFFRFVFKAKEGLEDGESQFKCNVIARAKINGVEQIVPLTAVPAVITIQDVLPGDVNGDDALTVDDAIYLLFHINFPSRYEVNQECDFDGNGVLTIDDAIYLLFHINFPSRYPLN